MWAFTLPNRKFSTIRTCARDVTKKKSNNNINDKNQKNSLDLDFRVTQLNIRHRCVFSPHWK